jgi:flagellar biosynthetic protein FliP
MRHYSRYIIQLLLALVFLVPVIATAQTTTTSAPVSMNIDFNNGGGKDDFSVAIQLVIFMTLLTLAPTIVMLMTSFTRIVIVLGFVGRALGTQGTPSNQIITGLALFLTFFLMAPVWEKVYDEGITPYMEEKITSKEAFEISSKHMARFMVRNTRESDLEFFLGLAGYGPTQVSNIPLQVVVPSFVLSELRTAFQMGFLIFIPFLVVDFLISSTLMAMGMMMMPPVIISMPFKLLLFVLVDGWTLIVRSLVQSFNF